MAGNLETDHGIRTVSSIIEDKVFELGTLSSVLLLLV